MRPKPKVLVVGLDSASHGVTSKLISRGSLPTLGRSAAEGCIGKLTSTIPPISPVAWPSLVTGYGPAKHGVFGFTHRDKNGKLVPYSSSRISGLTFWDVLGKAGLKVAVLNVPMTNPVYPVNGVMVSGPPTPSNLPTTYAVGGSPRLADMMGGYLADIPGVELTEYYGMDKRELCESAIAVTERKFKLAAELLRAEEYDLMMFVTTELDRLHHAFGSALYGLEYPGSNEDRKLLERYYDFIDEQLKSLFMDVDDDTIILVVSDHGFEPLLGYIGVNNILLDGGLVSSSLGTRVRQGILTALFGIFGDYTVNIARNILGFMRAKTNYQSIYDISSQSLAYSESPGLITVRAANDHDRDVITRRSIRLIEGFQIGGQRIVEKVYPGRELYGSYSEGVPDAVVVPKSGYEPRLWNTPTFDRHKIRGVDTTTKNCTHYSAMSFDGIFIARGRGVKKGVMTDCSILDIAPTIYQIFGFQIPADLDGHPLTPIFTENSGYSHEQPRGTPLLAMKAQGIGEMTVEEEREVMTRLSKLGYI